MKEWQVIATRQSHLDGSSCGQTARFQCFQAQGICLSVSPVRCLWQILFPPCCQSICKWLTISVPSAILRHLPKVAIWSEKVWTPGCVWRHQTSLVGNLDPSFYSPWLYLPGRGLPEKTVNIWSMKAARGDVFKGIIPKVPTCSGFTN